jgi:hypothetical protein
MRFSRASVLVLGTAFALAATPAVALAEVMDKEPPVSELWVWALFTGAVGLVAWSRLPRGVALLLGGVTVLAGGLQFLPVLLEVVDPFVGLAIAAEAGPGYAVHLWAAFAAFIAMQAVGVLAWMRRSPNKRVQQIGRLGR